MITNIAFTTNAMENNGKNDAEMFLLEIGMPKKIIEKYDKYEINKMYSKYKEDNIRFSGYKEEIVTVSKNGVFQEEIETYKNIPTAQLELKMVAFDRVLNDEVKGVILELTYKWIEAPFFTLTDAMTFNWDSTLFTLGGFYAESGYDIRDVANRYQWKQIDYIDRPARGTEGGIGWYLKTGLGAVGSTVTVDSNNRGGASISLGISKDGPSGGINFADGKYDEASTYIIYH